MTKKDIVLVANSPGELSALVKPAAEEFSKDSRYRIILVLTPCQYVSGKEIEYSRGIREIKEIISAAEYKRWIFLGQKPKIKFADQGAVLFLGGDLAHAMLIAKRLKYPAYAYIQEHLAWKKFYKKFFVPDATACYKFIKLGVREKLKIVGNLMVDSVANLKKWSPEKEMVTFMPGSREWEIDYMTPFYKKVLAILKEKETRLKFQVVSSPFAKAHPLEEAKMIEFEDIYNSELVITIPGTNTAKIAARGIPMLVVFPLNHPEVIPLEGVADIIGKVPVMGRAFKKWLAHVVNKKTKFFALPNQKAGIEIVPEIRGKITPEKVAEKVISLLKDKQGREKMSAKLIKSLGAPGAAKKIVEEIGGDLLSAA